MTIPV